MICWVVFLRKVDIYEPETWKYVIMALSLGMAFSFLTYPLSDINHLMFNFNINGNFLNDLLYCVLGIGAIEELVKIIPLLLLVRFTKTVNEPYDYILYASLSALGFAFMENLIYFEETSLQIIHGRALTAVVSHMFNSSVIAYGMVLNIYRRRRNPVLNFLLFWALASIAHGFYDFWLISDSVKGFQFLTILLLLITMYMWNSFKNNALNHSVFLINKKYSIIRNFGNILFTLSQVLCFSNTLL
ncbi:MAG: PrsW family intramembrane metalloprotease [Bacteroidales bacterium]|nr:PrsW family intramembrane metalloprotease [Bacteroidales bacterium]